MRAFFTTKFVICTHIDAFRKYLKCVCALQAAEVGYECLVHLTAPPVRIPATRLDQNTLVCDTFQVSSLILNIHYAFCLKVMLFYCKYTFGLDLL